MAGAPGERSRPCVVRDIALMAYLAATVVGAVQIAVLDDAGGIVRGVGPYVVALAVVLVLRHAGPGDPESFERWTRGLALAGVLLSLWLLVGFLGALPAGLGTPAGFYRVKVAVTSPVGDHNTAAGLLLPTAVAAAATAVKRPRWGWALVIVTLGLVATLSRGAAIVLLGVALAGLLVEGDRRMRQLLTASAAVALLLIVLLAFVLDASPPAGAELPSGGLLGASVLGRLDLATRGLQVGLAEPALGVGLGRFSEVATDLPPPNDHAHQLLAHAFAEGGIVLFAVAVAVPVVLAVRVARLPKGGPQEVLALGGLTLVAHAQIEILGGALGYEALLALLVGLAGSLDATRSASGVGQAP
jgi:hypothetical protein